ncbi:nickel/cobalt transporter [Psittacicella hinzii]|uniref:Nickel/cobalt efflux system n=1 Tax=Psittacicella hinzii TaxID=2028575 RepID=A0A3A1YR46_9GAMM|nr:hypothetical protein [Psittacicella hinzii]RIY40642.1 hypothetical protein CKF58_00255 [Psittacicella hinzii]
MQKYIYAIIAIVVILFITFFGFNAIYFRIVNVLSNFNNTLANFLMQAKNNPHAGFILMGISFLYGVLHAVGPGHGKFVLSSYSLATNPKFWKLASLGFTISLLQGVTAVVIGSVVLYLFTSSSAYVFAINDHLGLISGLMLSTLAIFWLVRSLIRLVKIYRLSKQHATTAANTATNSTTNNTPTKNTTSTSCNHSQCSHEHSHEHSYAEHKAHHCCSHQHEEHKEHHCCSHHHDEPKEHHCSSLQHDEHKTHEACSCPEHKHDSHTSAHTQQDGKQGEHHHEHGQSCSCHNHINWDEFNKLDNLRDRILMSLSIILRPCSGALAILVLGYALDLWWWGVASAMTMAVGTGIGLIFTVEIVNIIKRLGFNRFAGKPSAGNSMFVQGVVAAISLALLIVAGHTAYTSYQSQDNLRIYTRAQNKPLLQQNNSSPKTLPPTPKD